MLTAARTRAPCNATRFANCLGGSSFSLRCSYMTRSRRLRAIRLLRYGAPLIAQDIPDPIPRSGEVLIEIRAAGICHSDAHYRSEPGRVALPRTLGHEIAGVIAGTDKRVALHYLHPNGDMIGKDVDGGYAEKIA